MRFKKYISLILNTSLLTTIFFGFIIFIPGVYAAPLTYTPTATAGMIYAANTALSRINDGNISTAGVSDYQVHPTNAIGKTITMTLAQVSTVENVIFYNRVGCCGDRIGGANMVFKDTGGVTLYTYSFPGTAGVGNGVVPDIVTISDPGGDIVGVASVELTNFGVNPQNFREIDINGSIPTTFPILSVSKTDNDADDSVTTDQVVKYTVTIGNAGIDATGISLTDTIDTDFGVPYNFMYTSCGSPGQSFSDPTLSFSSIDILGGSNCIISYDLQVDSGAPGGNTITNSADPSAAIEGGNNPAAATADILTVLACGTNNVDLSFITDTYGEDMFWSLVPNGNACGVGEIANGGNTTSLDCSTGGTPATAAGTDPYADNTTITEGTYSLTVGAQYDIHVGDDFGDGNTSTNDVNVIQNGATTNSFEVVGDGGVFSFTVLEPIGCVDTTNPSVTIDQAPSQVDPTPTDSATFRAIFDEPINVASFIASDIIISGPSGSTTSGPTEIAPNNGTSFEFTVTGMTPSNTITVTIPTGVISDGAGNTNNASTSSDNQVTYNGVVSNPILSVSKTDNDVDNTVTTDQVIKYTVTIGNTGNDATGISLTDTIDTDFGTPYNFIYSSCGTPGQSFSDPTLSFSAIDILGGSSCIITYDLQVDSGAIGGSTITNSADPSAAIEGGNNPAAATADTLTVLACGTNNDVSLDFTTDTWGYETYWSLIPSGGTCGVGEVASGGNTAQVNCTSGGNRVATNGNGYASNTTISEGPISLTIGSSYDLHVVDDFGDGITTAPDINIVQNGATTNTFEVAGNGGVFNFTVTEPVGCEDTTNPSVTIEQAPSQADPTPTDSATFRAIFDEPINVASFIASDITLSGTTGTVTSGPTEVAPNNGTSFEFSVTGMTVTDAVTATIGAGVIEDPSANTNNASTSTDNQVTFDASDTTPPSIDSTNFASGSLLPGGNHDITIAYSDGESGIDSASTIMQLYKWDGVSAYGVNIAGTGITFNSASTSSASFSTNNLSFGKYQYRFSISDNDGNPIVYIHDFYIDQPEFIIGSGSIDMGNLSSLSNVFSNTVTITVKTVGAAFDVTMDRSSTFSEGGEEIPSYNGALGYGYQQTPYSSVISEIGISENIATQAILINTNGNKNTYTYDIQIGALIDLQQAAGDYMGNLDFSINLTY